MTDSKFTYHLTSYGVFKKSMEQIVKEHALWVVRHCHGTSKAPGVHEGFGSKCKEEFRVRN